MIEIPSHGTVYPQIGRGHPSKGHKKPVLTHQLSGGRIPSGATESLWVVGADLVAVDVGKSVRA